ncbi:MAG: ATP-binding protein [Desulfovibrionaceae bacterium]
MPRFELTGPATHEGCRKPVRDAVLLIQSHLADPRAVEDLDLALTEACTNVVRHAYPGDAPGRLRIRVDIDPGREVVVEVTDWGVGLPPGVEPGALPGPEAQSGRGFYLMARLCDEMTIRCDRDGTVVRLRKCVPGPGWNPDTVSPSGPDSGPEPFPEKDPA